MRWCGEDNITVTDIMEGAIYRSLGIDSKKFNEAYTAENKRIRREMTALSMRKKNGAERMNKRIKSLILCLTEFNMPPRGIISADIDDLTDYATLLVKADNGLLKRYGFNGGVIKNEDIMPFVEKDLRYIRKKCSRAFPDKKVIK